MVNNWTSHVKKTFEENRKKNSSYKFSQALKDAAKTYKKKEIKNKTPAKKIKENDENDENEDEKLTETFSKKTNGTRKKSNRNKRKRSFKSNETNGNKTKKRKRSSSRSSSSSWSVHIKKTFEENRNKDPNYSYKQAMKDAAKTYKKKGSITDIV